MSVPVSGPRHPMEVEDDESKKNSLKSYGEGEINALKESMEDAEKEGARPSAVTSGGATHVEGEHYRTPKEKMAAAIKDYADEPDTHKTYKHG